MATLTVENTVRPARYRFRDIANIYLHDAKAMPVDVEDGWAQFERVVAHANFEIACHLWDFWV